MAAYTKYHGGGARVEKEVGAAAHTSVDSTVHFLSNVMKLVDLEAQDDVSQ